MRDTPRKGQRLSGRKLVNSIANPEDDLPAEKDDLLVLTLVDMQREAVTEGLFGLPNSDASVALPGLNVNNDQCAGKPKTA